MPNAVNAEADELRQQCDSFLEAIYHEAIAAGIEIIDVFPVVGSTSKSLVSRVISVDMLVPHAQLEQARKVLRAPFDAAFAQYRCRIVSPENATM